MQIDVEIQEEKIKKEVLSKLKSVRKIRWKEKKSDLELEDALKKKFGLNKIISKLLVSRGIDTATYSKFSNPLIKNIMPDPFVIDSMECATKKIVEFILEEKKIHCITIPHAGFEYSGLFGLYAIEELLPGLTNFFFKSKTDLFNVFSMIFLSRYLLRPLNINSSKGYDQIFSNKS